MLEFFSVYVFFFFFFFFRNGAHSFYSIFQYPDRPNTSKQVLCRKTSIFLLSLSYFFFIMVDLVHFEGHQSAPVVLVIVAFLLLLEVCSYCCDQPLPTGPRFIPPPKETLGLTC